jgi:hypothetical protein
VQETRVDTINLKTGNSKLYLIIGACHHCQRESIVHSSHSKILSKVVTPSASSDAKLLRNKFWKTELTMEPPEQSQEKDKAAEAREARRRRLLENQRLTKITGREHNEGEFAVHLGWKYDD